MLFLAVNYGVKKGNFEIHSCMKDVNSPRNVYFLLSMRKQSEEVHQEHLLTQFGKENFTQGLEIF